MASIHSRSNRNRISIYNQQITMTTKLSKRQKRDKKRANYVHIKNIIKNNMSKERRRSIRTITVAFANRVSRLSFMMNKQKKKELSTNK